MQTLRTQAQVQWLTFAFPIIDKSSQHLVSLNRHHHQHTTAQKTPKQIIANKEVGGEYKRRINTKQIRTKYVNVAENMPRCIEGYVQMGSNSSRNTSSPRRGEVQRGVKIENRSTEETKGLRGPVKAELGNQKGGGNAGAGY